MGDGAVVAVAREGAQRRRRPRGEVNQAIILDACAALMARGNHTEFTIRDVAREAGIATGAIYTHFESKGELMAAVLERGIKTLHAAVAAAVNALPPDASPRLRIETAIRAHLSTRVAQGEYWLFAKHLRETGVAEVTWNGYDLERIRIRELWMSIILDAQRAGAIRSDAPVAPLLFFLLGAISWTAEWYDPALSSLDRIADNFVTFFFDGAGSPPAPGMA